MAPSSTLSVGMDGHTAAIAVASVAQEPGAEVVSLGTIGTRPWAMDQLLRPLQAKREEPLRALQAAQGRRTACVRRHALRSPGRTHWSPAHLRGLRAVVGPTPAQPLVLQADVPTVPAQTERLGRLARARHAPVHPWRFAPGGAALQALRGVPCTVAVTPVAELGDLTRCEHPRQLMPALGLPPAA